MLHSPSGYWQTKVLRREDPYLKVGEVNDRAHKGASEYVWALKDINLQKPLSLGHGQTSLVAALAHREDPNQPFFYHMALLSNDDLDKENEFQKLLKKYNIFAATIALFVSDIPVSEYIHILKNEPEKSASYSKFFVENYVNPDSVKITASEQKRNLILIYIESMETTFSDKEHGGNQDTNLIPEIMQLAQQNINFGKSKNHIGGGVDSYGSGATFAAMLSRSLGIPFVINYDKTPILHHYKSLYKILNKNGYRQIFFQGNPGCFKEFQNLVTDHKMDEIYGPDDLIERMNLGIEDYMVKQGGNLPKHIHCNLRRPPIYGNSFSKRLS